MFDIIAAGHICLDLLPRMDDVPVDKLASPGKLFEVDELSVSTGGSVSNTGLALFKLGVNVGLMGTVGDDLLGRVIVAYLKDRSDSLAKLIRVKPGQSSSYSVLLSPENADRIILHSTGTNDSFGVDDVDYMAVRGTKIFHLGYPPLLPALIRYDGDPLAEVFNQAKSAGAVTSLDTAHPDPGKFAGQVDWRKILGKTLPNVDVFLPSVEELVFMLRRDDYDQWGGDVLPHLSLAYVRGLADDLLAMGAAVVGFKMSVYGIYIRVTDDARRFLPLQGLGLDAQEWLDAEAYHPAFAANVVGTTGAGDSAYAGFLAALLRGYAPNDAVKMAAAVGSHNVEAADATSAIPSWETIAERIASGWETRSERLPGWGP